MSAAPLSAPLTSRTCTVAGRPIPHEWLGDRRLREEAASIDPMTGVCA